MRIWCGASALVAVLFVSACGSPEVDRGVWFVHATDPHLFEDRKTTDASEEAKKARWEGESRTAFRRLLETFDALPDTDVEPRFLLLTGDLGFTERSVIDGVLDQAVPADAVLEERAQLVATSLAQRPGLTVYFVPGNNDVAGERVENLEVTTRFLEAVQAQLPSGIVLHDLTACYRPGAPIGTGCTADIPGTRFRLIGFPTFSFKGRDNTTEQAAQAPPAVSPSVAEGPAAAATELPAVASEGTPGTDTNEPALGESALPVTVPPGTATSTGAAEDAEAARVPADSREATHERWMERLELLVSEARREGKRALIATHVPDLNDPYVQARRELYGDPSPDTTGAPPWSPWSVPSDLYERWREIVDSPTVAHILAGHFHDDHREIYRSPYGWERDPPGTRFIRRPDRGKLWIAPPLGVRLQEDSPIQARGFALVGLMDGRTVRRLYWYDRGRGVFEPDDLAPRERTLESSEAHIAWPLSALWDLGGETDPLEKIAILLIALIAAFLTIVAVWKIPPPDSELTRGEVATGSPSTQPTGPFENNFARTVLGGLTGLVGIAFIDAFWKESPGAHKTYYVVCFLVFFLVFLLLYSAVRGLVEVVRARLAHGEVFRERTRGRSPETAHHAEPFLLYWLRRFRHWFLSFRASGLVLFDTAFNVMQGQNQLETAVLGQTILELQKSLVATVDRTAEEIQRTIRHALAREGKSPGILDCRVNISVMSDDGQSLGYVSLGRGSLLRPFGPRSVAWIAVEIQQARWWRRSFDSHDDKIVIYENEGALADWEKSVKLDSVFAKRASMDYAAFVVLPFPWFGSQRESRRGAIHISLAKEEYLDLLWDGLDLVVPPTAATPTSTPAMYTVRYDEWSQLVAPNGVGSKNGKVQPRHADVNAALVQALSVLPEVLRRFNRPLFNGLIKPR